MVISSSVEAKRPAQNAQSVQPDTWTDSFADTRPAGKTIGSVSPSGIRRQGIDRENCIAVDNGALRLQPLINPGWGKQGIAYGPYHRTNGLTFAVFLLNGHNTSGAGTIERLRNRLRRWLLGSETHSPRERLQRWCFSSHWQRLGRRLLWWIRSSPDFAKRFQAWPLPKLNENLAVGWFSQAIPQDPRTEGHGFIMHGAEAKNGELWTRTAGRLLSAIPSVQNLPLYCVVVLRAQGAAYYVASMAGAHGLVPYPQMRPIAIDSSGTEETVYAALYQSVLGQIGFRVDTRVYGAQVVQIPEFNQWFGTAHGADCLTGTGDLRDRDADMGGSWYPLAGRFKRTARGIIALETHSKSVLNLEEPSGLIHLLVETSGKVTGVALLWRVQDDDNGWQFLADAERSRLQMKTHGRWITVAVSELWHLRPHRTHSLQILDDGAAFRLYLDGALVFGKAFCDAQLSSATGVGIGAIAPNSTLHFRALEAHPRCVAIPSVLDMGAPWTAQGYEIVIADTFTGLTGDLHGHPTQVGDRLWQRAIGQGRIERTGHDSAQVRANTQTPNPGRTAYTVPWDRPNLADLEVTITPPGTGRWQRQKGRAGLIFWQDTDNYIIVNNWLDDLYSGASISSFFHLNGFEELYDAVWTNVHHRVFWGVAHRLRVVFDGLHYSAFVNDEPVLYRSLTDVYADAVRLQIRRVGIVANWEWGNDTGSVFNDLVARA